MTIKYEVNQLVEGEVVGIQPYGAFIALDEDTQGLVHISEIAHGFVKNIQDHIKVGEKVTVKILNIDEENNKFSLSIRATIDQPSKRRAPKKQVETNNTTGFNTMKDQLEVWLQQSK